MGAEAMPLFATAADYDAWVRRRMLIDLGARIGPDPPVPPRLDIGPGAPRSYPVCAARYWTNGPYVVQRGYGGVR